MKRYTVFIYDDESTDKLVYTERFDNEQDAIGFADSVVNQYARVEIIDNELNEKIY